MIAGASVMADGDHNCSCYYRSRVGIKSDVVQLLLWSSVWQNKRIEADTEPIYTKGFYCYDLWSLASVCSTKHKYETMYRLCTVWRIQTDTVSVTANRWLTVVATVTLQLYYSKYVP